MVHAAMSPFSIFMVGGMAAWMAGLDWLFLPDWSWLWPTKR